VRYVPSAYELEWALRRAGEPDNSPVCDVQAGAEHKPRVEAVLRAIDAQHLEGYQTEASGAADAALDELEEEGGLLSIMEYELSTGEVVRVRMEPLVGLLRDPRVSCFGGARDIWQPKAETIWEEKDVRQWLLQDSRRMELHKGQRAVLMDMGGSRWAHSSGARWINKRMAQQGVELEHIWVWEAKQMAATDYFAGSTMAERSRTHFYNWGVALGAESPWAMLKQQVKPEDFVVVKLDIDSPEIEIPLAYELLEDKELLGLVDEVRKREKKRAEEEERQSLTYTHTNAHPRSRAYTHEPAGSSTLRCVRARGQSPNMPHLPNISPAMQRHTTHMPHA
jgi:hypothetical protein